MVASLPVLQPSLTGLLTLGGKWLLKDSILCIPRRDRLSTITTFWVTKVQMILNSSGLVSFLGRGEWPPFLRISRSCLKLSGGARKLVSLFRPPST